MGGNSTLYTLRNPLYHWTHLELQRYFGIHELLSPQTAKKIYDECNEKLQSPEFSVRNLIKSRNVEVVCTTDDPLDNLIHHQKIKQDGYAVKVLPAFRPDKAMQADDIQALNAYINQLETIIGIGYLRPGYLPGSFKTAVTIILPQTDAAFPIMGWNNYIQQAIPKQRSG